MNKFVLAAILIFSSEILFAAGKGQAGIQIEDGLPVYADSTGDTIIGRSLKGWAVSGVNKFALKDNDYKSFEKSNGRVRFIAILPNKDDRERGKPIYGWMNQKDLSVFYYSCDCSPKTDEQLSTSDRGECTPLERYSGFGSSEFKWNSCFEEARDQKLESLHITPSELPKNVRY